MNEIKISEALRDLDKHASEFNFPVLDNAYVRFAGARMSILRGNDSWCVAFEILGYTENNGNFENYLYAYGNCLQREGLIIAETVASQVENHPLIDPFTQAWIGDLHDWWISVDGEAIHFAPSNADYSAVGIIRDGDGPGSLHEEDVLRYFIETKGSARLFMSVQSLSENLKGCPSMTVLLQTESWEHPDVSGEVMPSESVSIRSIFSVLTEGTPKMFQSGRINTHWKVWDQPLI